MPEAPEWLAELLKALGELDFPPDWTTQQIRDFIQQKLDENGIDDLEFDIDIKPTH